MAEDSNLLEGYQAISEADQKKANTFFERGLSVANSGQFEYAIEMFLQGLNVDPENTDAHQQLRDISLKRKASGGKDLGMFEKMKLRAGIAKGKDNKANVLTAEKLLAYDPGNTDNMMAVFENAFQAGFYDTVLWIGQIALKANSDDKKPDFNKYIKLKNIYATLQVYDRAVEACQYAAMLKPDDMDLTTELKNLGAQHTMSKGGYGKSKSFRDSIRDKEKQQQLMESDKDVHSSDFLRRQVADAETEYNADPNEVGKIMKYVEALVKTESPEYEQRAVDVLQQAYERTNAFRFRFRIGQIRMMQMSRRERELLKEVRANPSDAALTSEYKEFQREKAELELDEFRMAAENYPTDMTFKYNMAARLFALGRYSDAIPVFQTARQDPKYRVDAAIALGRSFLSAGGYVDEAIDTLRDIINDYELKGDPKSKEMYYWYAVANEQKGDSATALKAYSQVAQWDFNYRDVQARVKRLRGTGGATNGNGGGGSPI